MISKMAKMEALKKMSDGYKEPMSKSADVEEDTAENEMEEETQDWSCPECGTTCCATMPQKKMSCPCCGTDMETED